MCIRDRVYTGLFGSSLSCEKFFCISVLREFSLSSRSLLSVDRFDFYLVKFAYPLNADECLWSVGIGLLLTPFVVNDNP